MNLVDILKYAPKGLKLWSDVFGEVFFDKISEEGEDTKYPIILTQCDGCNELGILNVTKRGAYTLTQKGLQDTRPCVLWPSEDYRSWDNWQQVLFKDGDIVCNECGSAKIIAIFKKLDWRLICHCGLSSDGSILITNEDEPWGWDKNLRYASPDEKERLFKKLREEGYKWDGEKKELRKMSFGLKELEHTISCGACDSELIRTEWAVPEGYTAKVEFGKIIVEKNQK